MSFQIHLNMEENSRCVMAAPSVFILWRWLLCFKLLCERLECVCGAIPSCLKHEVAIQIASSKQSWDWEHTYHVLPSWPSVKCSWKHSMNCKGTYSDAQSEKLGYILFLGYIFNIMFDQCHFFTKTITVTMVSLCFFPSFRNNVFQGPPFWSVH